MNRLMKDMDYNDTNNISCLAHICTYNPRSLVKNDYEEISLLFYNCFNTLEPGNYCENIQNIIDFLQKQNFFLINKYKIFVANTYFFKSILLFSLKHSNMFNKRGNSVSAKNIANIIHSILLLHSANIEYVPILRILESILKQYKHLIEYDLSLEIFMLMQKISVYPIEGFKYYSQIISKYILPFIYSRNNYVLDVKLLPLGGIETSELVCYYNKKIGNELFSKEVLFKVLDMFSNNIASREGGFLYKVLLLDNFNNWKRLVWPYFRHKIINIDFEGEFIQSLLKYWIPFTINMYGLAFYNHIYDTNLSMYVKGQVLLATRRKDLFEKYTNQMICNLNYLIMNKKNRLIGLHILSLFQKRNIYPTEYELGLIKLFLYSQGRELASEESKFLYKYMSHLTVKMADLQNASQTNNELLLIYGSFYRCILNYGYSLIKSERFEFGAQILQVFWNLHQGHINVCYKVDVPIYPNFNMEDYIQCHNVCDLIEHRLMKYNFNNPEIANLACYLSNYTKFDNNFLIEYVNKNGNNISIKTSESVKNLAKIVTTKNNANLNVELCYKLHDETKRLLLGKLNNDPIELKHIFEGVLLFDAILEVMKKNILTDLSNRCYQELQELLIAVVNRILNCDLGLIKTDSQSIQDDIQHLINNKTKKIVEAFLNNVLQYIKDVLNFLDTKTMVSFLKSIIESSNMRRPTTTSAQILTLATGTMYNDYDKDEDFQKFKILYLNDILFKLLQAPSVQHLTIRRNPESRLIIHAFCASDKTPQKNILKWICRELLKILSRETKDSALSSSLHCIETLISDNTLHRDTFEFIPEVFLISVKLFNHKSWIVRNANIQLAKALIDRFHGVLVGYNNRPKSIEDLFNIFPDLALPFFKTIANEFLMDSAIIVMQYFSESQVKKMPFENETLTVIKNGFFRLFIKIIKNSSNHYGVFAVRAYVALCLEEHIPVIIRDIIDYIVSNMNVIRQKHTISNFMLLLNELYHKHKIYVGTLFKQPNDTYLIKEAFRVLSIFLQNFDRLQFDLLLVKIVSVNNALSTFNSRTHNTFDWKERVWQNNYLAYICINCDENKVSLFLETIYTQTLLDCIQIKILNVLLDRYCNGEFSKSTINNILQCLIRKIYRIEDNKHYLLLCYFNIIFCFIHMADQLDATHVRPYYGTLNNVYKIFVTILLLNYSSLQNDDRLFIKKAVKSLHHLNINNAETAYNVSKMLPYFYQIVTCVCQKIILFKMAVFLILEYDCWHFVTFISKSRYPSALSAIVKILNFETLSEHFNDSASALRFVTEIFEYTYKKSKDKIINSQHLTYYAEDENSYVDYSSINKIVLKFLVDYNKKSSNREWFESYQELININKK